MLRTLFVISKSIVHCDVCIIDLITQETTVLEISMDKNHPKLDVLCLTFTDVEVD